VCVVAKFDLVFGRFAIVLDMSAFEVAVEGFEVEEGGDVGVCGGTVVALVEVVGENLPVVGACKVVSVNVFATAKSGFLTF
jgi:hypothetical protein